MLPRMNLQLDPALSCRISTQSDAIGQLDPGVGLSPGWISEPGIQHLAHSVERRPDRLSPNLYEVYVFRISVRRIQIELGQCRPPPESQRLSDHGMPVELDESPADDEVLFYLLVRGPRRRFTPFSDKSRGNQMSGSKFTLIPKRQRRSRVAPRNG